MRSLTLLCLFLLFILLATAVLADTVITVDPNTPGTATVTEAVIENDLRLDQKITYYSGYKRLHVVTDELSQMTGVTIYSGLSSKNWQVRDIPVVVCVKDLPLGKVLQAIADAAHLRLSSRKIEDQGKVTWTYRLSRSVKEEIEIDTLLEKKHESELGVDSWAWDALRKCGQHPELEGVDRDTMLVSQLIASLGEDAKEKFFAYDTFHFKTSDPRYRSILRELFTRRWNECAKSARKEGITPDQPTDEEMDATNFTIKLIGTFDDYELTPVTVKNASEKWYGGFGWNGSLTLLSYNLLHVKDLDLPAFPTPENPPSLKADMTDPDMIILDSDQQWNRPTLNKPFDLKKPADKTPVFSDLIEDISKATGMNIVCDDFMSHKTDGYQSEAPVQYKDGNTLRNALQIYKRVPADSHQWFISDKDNLLVGWTGGAGWRENHRNLMPESYLASLKKKLDNEGVTIDDAAGLTSFTQQQYMDWIHSSRDWDLLHGCRLFSDPAIWMLYNRLKPEDRALAKSEAGLPLAKLDPQWIREAFLEQKGPSFSSVTVYADMSGEEERKKWEEEERREEAMTDPDIISTMTMRLVETPETRYLLQTTSNGRTETTVVPVPKGLRLSNYHIEIDYGEGGQDRMEFEGPDAVFPIYSAKREAEIFKEDKDLTGR